MNWTQQQEAAIQGRCKKLLVSAAAGSGKTAVLVERVFRRISDAKDPHDVTDFLIVTFTNAAAAEMRARILKRLGEALAAEPQNRHLRRQMNLIHEAQIMTVHAFCLSLIRENFHILGLRPDFRLPDEDETGLLLDEAAERLMEEEHELRSPAFLALLEAVAYEKNDGRLKELLKRAHIWLESEADAERYMAERAAEGAVPADADPGETPWGRVHLDRLALEAS
ncbi:MAG: helicase-exonuclease AddAB subunit AddA, partial [Clostridiales bacterium]